MSVFFSSLEGDFTWPVASFPLHKINHKILSSMVWKVCENLGNIMVDENNTIQVLYGVSDGSTYSHAFFSRAGAQNWVTYNPFNNNKPIWWLSDYPHMIKKLRNFIVNPEGALQLGAHKIHVTHLVGVVERRMTKLSWKHIKLTPRTNVALYMLKSSSPVEETSATRTYLINCYKLFKLFNNNTEIDGKSYRHLLKIMLWFDKWYSEVNDQINRKESTAKGGTKKLWKKFIPRITYKDLKRSVRAFLGVVQYVQMNFPHVQIIPKTMCQDDVENYFSLQRARVPGEKQTVLQFYESSASLNKQMLLNSEMKDLTGTCGSYDIASLPNAVSIPLTKHNNKSKQAFSEKEGWDLCQTLLTSKSEIVERWLTYDKTFHDNADKQQLSRHVKQTIEYIDLFSPTTIIQTSQPIISGLRASTNHCHLLSFACNLDHHLRTNFFCENWKPNALQLALNSLKEDKALCFYWKSLLCNTNLSDNLVSISCDVISAFVRKFAKRRCVLYLAIDGLNPTHQDDESAVRQMLKKI